MVARRRALLGSFVAALALVGASCGGDDEPSASEASASEWADGFCTAVTTWTSELEEIGDAFRDPSTLSTDAVKQAARDAGAATEQFVTDVRALGAPDTEAGEQVQDSVDELADMVEQQKSEIEEAVEDASGLTGLTAAIASVGTALSSMATAFQSTLETLEAADASGELEQALEDSEACDELTG